MYKDRTDHQFIAMNANKIENQIQLNNFYCDGFIFDSNFDSGNLLKVECIRKPNGN